MCYKPNSKNTSPPNPPLVIIETSYVISALLRVTLNGQMVVMGYFVDVIRGYERY